MYTVGDMVDGNKRILGEYAQITGGLDIGDTITVLCNKNVGCYATVVSGTKRIADLL
jgi:hypothetical protein